MKTGIVFALITAGFVIYGLRDNNYPKSNRFCGVKDEEKVRGTCGTESGFGEKVPIVFKAKCSTCHMKYKDATGPKLLSIEQWMPDSNYFEQFVRNQKRLLQQKDKYTIAITESRVTDFIHEFKEITPSEMGEIRTYLKH